MRWGTVLRPPIVNSVDRVVRLPLQNPDEFAFVDIEDLLIVSRFNWHSSKRNHTKYAVTTLMVEGKLRKRYLHHLVMGSNREVDHRDGNGLNNRRKNLRHCLTHSQNNANSRSRRSGYKGIEKAAHNQWWARTKIEGKSIRIGKFHSEEEAARAYDAFMLDRFGDFSRLNFPIKKESL